MSLLNSTKRYMVGLSGGVDSATTCALLQSQGHKVQPIFMHNWEEDDHCHISDDIAECEAVCNHLSLDLEVINFQQDYFNEVFEHSLQLLQQGLTPNPDIMCNSRIKFQLLSQHAQANGYDALATGHYAHTETRDGQIALIQAPDPIKDQTYFLSQLTQDQLSYAYFPLGQYSKSQTRGMAQNFQLPNAHRKDSVGICFVGNRKFDQFLQQYLLTRPGDMVTTDGLVVGQHTGLFCYTIGQRKGLGIGGVKHSSPSPWYVIEKDLPQNQLIVSQDESLLLKNHVQLEPIHWIRGIPETTKLKAKLRHGPDFINVTVDPVTHSVTFQQPQLAPTPGQHIVFYLDDECLGGGMILTAGNHD
jgi:tRNA-specific 2-thiouridylase